MPAVLLIMVLAAALFFLRWKVWPAKPADETEPDAASAEAVQAQPKRWSLLLVGADKPLDRAFTLDLQKVEEIRVDARIGDLVKMMLAAAKADGVELKICSGYRSVSQQTKLYQDKVKEFTDQGASEDKAKKKAGRTVQPPGCSEHHIGLALDIVAPYHPTLDEGFAETAAFQWLKDHAADYGFILRYPKEKEDITGIDYEPWHYRYVGPEAALAMKESGECLEEYVGK